MNAFNGLQVGLLEVTSRLVVPIAAQLLRADEVRVVETVIGEHVPARIEGNHGPHASIFARLIVGEEEFRYELWSEEWLPETWEEVAERLGSSLQDWISESQFGWGELREYSTSEIT